MSIPKSLDDALVVLQRLMSEEDLEQVRQCEHVISMHHTVGRTIRNNWELWNHSILAAWFNGIGIKHPDDMSAIILDALHLKLNNKLFDLTQIKQYQEYWENVSKEEPNTHSITVGFRG